MATIEIEWTNPVQGLLLLAHTVCVVSIFKGEIDGERQIYRRTMGTKTFTVNLEGVDDTEASSTRGNLLRFTEESMSSFDLMVAHRGLHGLPLRFGDGCFCTERYERVFPNPTAGLLMAAMMLHLMPDAEVVVDNASAGSCQVELFVAPLSASTPEEVLLSQILGFADVQLWTYMAERMRRDLLQTIQLLDGARPSHRGQKPN